MIQSDSVYDGAEHGDVDDPRITTDLVAGVSRGAIDPSTLPVDRRRDCVAFLAQQGYSIPESAQLLHVSERTIERDRAANRAVTAMQPSATLGDELMGQLQQTIAASNQRLTRLATDTQTPPYVKVWAENTIVKNCTVLIDKAERLGYYRDARARLDEALEEDPGERRRKAKAAARRDAIMRGLDPDAPPPPTGFDPTVPEPVLEDLGIEDTVDQARARLVFLEKVIVTDTTERPDDDLAESEDCLALIRRTRAGLERAAESLHDTVAMERGYSWSVDDDAAADAVDAAARGDPSG